MIKAFTKQLTAESGQAAQTGFVNTLANTTSVSITLPNFERPTGPQPANQSKLIATTGGGFLNTVPASGDPWQERYSLDLKALGSLPSGAVLEVDFEDPLDPSTPVIVRIYNIPSGPIHLESPLLSGFKCRNYWALIYVYSDNSQATTLDSYDQWINSTVDLGKVTSVADFLDNKTCQ